MRLVFMGSPEFSVPALRAVHEHHEVALVVTQPDKKAGRGRKMTAPAVKSVAEELSLPVVQPNSARSPEFAARLEEVDAMAAVVVAYGKILPRAVLEVFPHGCLNIHGSILPEWRGAAPIQRAIMSGQNETGVSIMLLDEGMDTGPVFDTARVPISQAETTGSLAAKLAPLGAERLLMVLEMLTNGTAHSQPQNHSAATHAAMLRKEDGLVDWSRSARLVSAQIRGVDPWPGAYAFVAGARIKLFGARVTKDGGAPGQIVKTDPLVVACGDGAVEILHAQAPGKKRMASPDLARGLNLSTGSRFGRE